MRLLFAVDSVVTTEMLMNAVASRPWPRGTRARVLSGVEDDAVPAEVWREAGYRADAVRQEMRRRGEQVAALAVEPFRQLGVEAEVAIMRGDPRWLITMEARKWPADLILIRAHNRADFRNWMLGSVSKSVVREAPCSVEVVRAAGEDLKVTGNGHLRILLATDGSEHAVAAAREVAECPWPEGTEVKVMSIISPVLYSLEEIGLFDGGGTDRVGCGLMHAAVRAMVAERYGVVLYGSEAERLTRELGTAYGVAPDPLHAVINGAGQMLAVGAETGLWRA
ncbi:MAG: universal stress protein [Acidobacteriota bacterium]|nr:universal stress protein [Acidobacteriota bacterium]